MIWIRRGYGAFVQCKNEAKARNLARHWAQCAGGGNEHPVIGMFKANSWQNLCDGKVKYTRLHEVADPAGIAPQRRLELRKKRQRAA